MNKKMSAFRLTEETIGKINDLASMVEYSSQAHVIEVAVDRLHNGSIKEIIYAVDTNEDGYTIEEDDEQYVPALIDRIVSELNQYMSENYPGIRFDTVLVPETMSYSNRSRWDATTLQAEIKAMEIIEELEHFVSDNWTDWFEEVCEAG